MVCLLDFLKGFLESFLILLSLDDLARLFGRFLALDGLTEPYTEFFILLISWQFGKFLARHPGRFFALARLYRAPWHP
jgi:hypothetical protein